MIYYFGCWGDLGHFLWGPHRRSFSLTALEKLPWGVEIDAGLCPAGPEVQGNAALHQKQGWTALSFWDRTVDKRGKSNSAFLADFHFGLNPEAPPDDVFKRITELAKDTYPEIWDRIGPLNLVHVCEDCNLHPVVK